MIPGVPTTVLQNDAVRAGQFRISGVLVRNVTITFTLPTVMTRIGAPAATMPLTFLNNSAGFTTVFQGNTPFNPNAPYNETIWFNATITLGRAGHPRRRRSWAATTPPISS